MKKIIYILFVFTFYSISAQKKLTNSQAINLVSKQAMLLERIAKAQVNQFCKIEVATSKSELNSSSILFEKNISTLKKIKLTDQIQSEIDLLELLWLGYERNTSKQKRASIKKTLRFNDVIVAECNSIYKSILSLANKNKSYPYNFKNKALTAAVINNNDLKYLSQRLSLFYSSYYYKLTPYDNDNFSKIIKDIDARIQKTLAVKNYNSEISEKTEILVRDWNATKERLLRITKSGFISISGSPKPNLIFKICNKILSNSDKLSRTYKATNDIN